MDERIELLARRARRLRARGEYRKAANAFGELTSIDPEHAPWWVLMGAMLRVCHRDDAASKALRQAAYLFRRGGQPGRERAVRQLADAANGLTRAA
jgi:Flp pilus assembly protein TadD